MNLTDRKPQAILGLLTKDDIIRSVYVYNGGILPLMGRLLIDHWTDYKAIDHLFDYGNMIHLGSQIGFQNPFHAPNYNDHLCCFQYRDFILETNPDDTSDFSAKLSKDYKTFYRKAKGCEAVYLFRKGLWLFKHGYYSMNCSWTCVRCALSHNAHAQEGD